MASGRDFVQFLISTGSTRSCRHPQRPSMRRPHRSVVRYKVKPPPLFGWHTAESAVDQRSVPQESRPRSGYRSAPEFGRNTAAKVICRDESRYFDTKLSSISATPFTKNQRIREQPTRSEAVEVRESKRACTFNGQFYGRGGARAALQNHGLGTCGRNCADGCGRNRRHERLHRLVNRCDGCHSRYEHAGRLPDWDEHSRFAGGCIIKVSALNAGSAPRALTARARYG